MLSWQVADAVHPQIYAWVGNELGDPVPPILPNDEFFRCSVLEYLTLNYPMSWRKKTSAIVIESPDI